MDMDPNGLITSLGIGGALVWYLYYTTSVTGPKRDEAFTKALESITDKFTSELEKEREFRRAELREYFRNNRCDTEG